MRARAIPNFARRASRESTEPKAVLEHRAPKTFPPILHTRGVESKVGRAVHCAPVWVVQSQLLARTFDTFTVAHTFRSAVSGAAGCNKPNEAHAEWLSRENPEAQPIWKSAIQQVLQSAIQM